MNKIVEILEKAKSCYWPALQNVYMNVTQGEPDTVHEAPGPMGGVGGCENCLSLTPGVRHPHEGPFSPPGEELRPLLLPIFTESLQR